MRRCRHWGSADRSDSSIGPLAQRLTLVQLKLTEPPRRRDMYAAPKTVPVHSDCDGSTDGNALASRGWDVLRRLAICFSPYQDGV